MCSCLNEWETSQATLTPATFASPEEIPVLFDLERFVPADRLQNVAIGDEAIADVMAPANRASLFQECRDGMRSRRPLLRNSRGRSSSLLRAASRSMS